METELLTCAQDGVRFPARPGRGKQSPYCEGCRAQRRRTMAAIRQLRYANTMMNEWVEALGPRIIREKEELTARQEGRCARCHRKQRLYFALDADEETIGLCADCHQQWTDERRSPNAVTR